MIRINPVLLERLRGYQSAPEETTPPAATLPKGVTYNARLERYYARRDGQFVGSFASCEDASAAASGMLTGLELLEAMLR